MYRGVGPKADDSPKTPAWSLPMHRGFGLVLSIAPDVTYHYTVQQFGYRLSQGLIWRGEKQRIMEKI